MTRYKWTFFCCCCGNFYVTSRHKQQHRNRHAMRILLLSFFSRRLLLPTVSMLYLTFFKPSSGRVIGWLAVFVYIIIRFLIIHCESNLKLIVVDSFFCKRTTIHGINYRILAIHLPNGNKTEWHFKMARVVGKIRFFCIFNLISTKIVQTTFVIIG